MHRQRDFFWLRLEDAANSISSSDRSGKGTWLVPRHESPGVTGMRNHRHHSSVTEHAEMETPGRERKKKGKNTRQERRKLDTDAVRVVLYDLGGASRFAVREWPLPQ